MASIKLKFRPSSVKGKKGVLSYQIIHYRLTRLIKTSYRIMPSEWDDSTGSLLILFTPETQHSYVYKLSGGERRRLYLCTVLMRNPNFLVLDEPTNDLDIITLQVLEEYLQNFKGCVIVVSHDRYFMDKVVDHLLVFKGQGDIRDFPGNYSDYRDWREAKEQRDKEAEKPKEEKTARVRLNDKRKMSFKEKKEFEQLEQEIAGLEQEKADIEAALCSGTLGVEELTEKSKRLPELNDLIDEKTMRWLELSEIEG